MPAAVPWEFALEAHPGIPVLGWTPFLCLFLSFGFWVDIRIGWVN